MILNSSSVVEKLVVKNDPLCPGNFDRSFFLEWFGQFLSLLWFVTYSLTLLVSLVCKKKSKYGVCFFLVFLIGLKECRYPCISTSKKQKYEKKTSYEHTRGNLAPNTKTG